MNKPIKNDRRRLPPRLRQGRGRPHLLVRARRRAASAARRRRTRPNRRQAQRLGDDRRRQHHHHPLPGRRDGPGRADVAAADPGRRARCRLVEGEVRVAPAQSRRCYGNRAQDVPGRAGRRAASVSVPGLFHAAADRRRAGAQGAARQRRGRMERAGRRTDHRQEHGRSTRSPSAASPTATSPSSPRSRPNCRRSPKAT